MYSGQCIVARWWSSWWSCFPLHWDTWESDDDHDLYDDLVYRSTEWCGGYLSEVHGGQSSVKASIDPDDQPDVDDDRDYGAGDDEDDDQSE